MQLLLDKLASPIATSALSIQEYHRAGPCVQLLHKPRDIISSEALLGLDTKIDIIAGDTNTSKPKLDAKLGQNKMNVHMLTPIVRHSPHPYFVAMRAGVS